MKAVWNFTDAPSVNLRATKSELRPVQSEPSLITWPEPALRPAFGTFSARSFNDLMNSWANFLGEQLTTNIQLMNWDTHRHQTQLSCK